MRVLITGAGGQLGRELRRTVPPGAEIAAPARGELDITDAEAVRAFCAGFGPDWIVNAAAYTAVDRAESDASDAYAVNADAVRHLAEAGAAHGARLLQVSTDFVFDGEQGRPYRPGDATHPLGVYGASKLAGERNALAVPEARALVVRTAWVYAAQGHNFVHTMLRLMRERDRLGVVADQVGTPTAARGLAGALWALIAADADGIHQWTDAGVASWYDFAVAIHDEAHSLGLLDRVVKIDPLTSADYPTPAQRPAYSVLDKSATWQRLGEPAAHWRAALRGVLAEIAAQESQ